MSAIPSGRNQLSSTKTQTLAQQTQADWLGKSLNKQVYRRWQTGDVYAPHDLSPVEMQKWRTKGRPETDAFDALDMNPIDEYKVDPFHPDITETIVLTGNCRTFRL